MKAKALTKYPLHKLHSSTFMVGNRLPRNSFILVFPPPFLLMSSGSFRTEWIAMEYLSLRPILSALLIDLDPIIVVFLLLRTLALITA